MDLLFKYLKLILFLTQLDRDRSKRTACLTKHNIRQQAGKEPSYTISQQKKLSPAWGNLLKGTPLASKSRRNNKHKLRNLGGLTLLALIGSLLFPTSAKAVTTTLNFSDTAPTLVSGTALTQGAVYRFKNVASGVDALVTIATVSNATLTNIDDNTNPSAAFASRFQPVINHISAVNTTSYIRFNFQLVIAGTTTPTSVTNVYFSAQDVDGGGANTIREFVQVIGAQATYLSATIPTPTLLQTMAIPPVVGGTAYEQISAANTQDGIGTADNYEMYSYIGNSVSSFTIIGGNINGSTGCSGAACPRQNSWTFDIADVQRLDFGDAPSTYGDAYHAVPPAPTVYLGTTPIVDGDDGPNYSATANGDDTTGTDDENGVATFPALTQTATTYSITAACTGNNAAVSAWIDFNRNGTFETTERTTGTCNNTSVTLNWTGLSGLSAGATFARLRIGSTAAQISTSTGIASNGEVEDYPLTIAAVPATVSGSLYRDANNDNAFTTGETKLPANIDVELVNSSGTVVATVQTNATGDYTFANVPAGTGYQVRVVTSDPQIPTGFVIGTTNPITGINVTAGATVTNQNFGFDVTVSGTLYQDTNGNNAFDSGEPRLPAGITVTLYNDANSNNIIDTGEQVGSPVTTDANGNYTFTAIANGTTYKLRVDTADSDIPAGQLLGTPNNLAVTVNNASVSNQNFGFDPPATLPADGSSFCAVPYPEVYIGTATNSIYAIHTDTGASVLLTSNASAAANSLATDHNNRLVYYADANSIYAYDVINNNHITITNNVSSFLPTGYTFNNVSSGGASFYNGSLYLGIDGVTNGQAADILRVNFSADGRTVQRVTPLYLGARGLATTTNWGDFIIGNNGVLYGSAQIEGQYWSLDLNSSSSQIINLNTGTTVFQLAKSGDGRLWAFSGTPTNVQQIDQSTGSLLGTSKVTTVATAAADAAECVRGQAIVGDRVWNDYNGNGAQDTGEPGIAGVTIEIYRDINKNGTLDAGEPLLGTKITDANGNYSFTDLLPHERATGAGFNDFIVRVNGGVPTGTTATTPATVAVDLSSATQIYNTADFGYRSGSTVSGTLYIDSNGSSSFDSGESVLAANITVNLINSSNNSIVATTTTQSDGTYTFTSVANGNYKVRVDTNDPDIPTGAVLRTVNDLAATVSGTNVASINFGFDPPKARLLLVKRITAINSTAITTVVDDPNDSNDTNANWPSGYITGATTQNNIKPGDVVEYTIYFLSTGGSDASNASLCDLVPANATFALDAFATGKGIRQALGATITDLTNTADTDVGQFYSATATPPASCRIGQTVTNGNGTITPTNVNGAVVVNLGTVPTKTSNVNKYYGFVKFRAKVN